MPKELSTVTQFWERTCALVFWVTSLGSNPSKGRKVTFSPLNWPMEWAFLTAFLNVKASPTHNFCLLCQHLFLPKVWKNIIFTRCSLQCYDPREKCLFPAFCSKICICESVLMPHHYSYAKQMFHNPFWFRGDKRNF